MHGPVNVKFRILLFAMLKKTSSFMTRLLFKRLCAETRGHVINHVLRGRATLCLSKTLDFILLLYGVHFASVLKSTFQTWLKSCYSRSK